MDECAGAQSRPQVAVSRDGSAALVVWESNAGATLSVYGRLLGYDPNTLAVTLPSAAFALPDSASGTRRLPAVAEWAGGFAVLWRDDALGWVLRRLSPLGVLGPEQTISTALGPTATLSPSLIALQDGSRLVAALPGSADILTLAGLCSPTPTLEDCADDCTTDRCMNLSCISNPVGVDCGP